MHLRNRYRIKMKNHVYLQEKLFPDIKLFNIKFKNIFMRWKQSSASFFSASQLHEAFLCAHEKAFVLFKLEFNDWNENKEFNIHL